MYSQVIEPNKIVMPYYDSVKNIRSFELQGGLMERIGTFYKHKFDSQKRKKQSINLMEFIFIYGENRNYMCDDIPEFLKNIAGIFSDFGINLASSKDAIVSRLIKGQNEETVLKNIKVYNSCGGDIFLTQNGQSLLVPALERRYEKVVLYLLKKGYSLNFSQKDWQHARMYPEDVPTVAIGFKMMDVLKYCIEVRNFNYFKQYKFATNFESGLELKNNRLLHIAVFYGRIEAVDYLLSLNEDLNFRGECQYSPAEVALYRLEKGVRNRMFYELISKPKLNYSQYKNLIAEGDKYYTDDMIALFVWIHLEHKK